VYRIGVPPKPVRQKKEEELLSAEQEFYCVGEKTSWALSAH